MKEQNLEKFKRNLPMIATYSRIALTPIIVLVLFIDESWSGWAAAFVFMLASITDWLDGYWARLFNSESAMGKFMDPIADKILVLGCLIMLLDSHTVDPFMVLLLISRDIFIGGIRSVAAANNVIIAAKPFGKWKTGFQMIGIPMMFVGQGIQEMKLQKIGYSLLWISVGLSIISGLQYTLGYYNGTRRSIEN